MSPRNDFSLPLEGTEWSGLTKWRDGLCSVVTNLPFGVSHTDVRIPSSWGLRASGLELFPHLWDTHNSACYEIIVKIKWDMLSI